MLGAAGLAQRFRPMRTSQIVTLDGLDPLRENMEGLEFRDNMISSISCTVIIPLPVHLVCKVLHSRVGSLACSQQSIS